MVSTYSKSYRIQMEMMKIIQNNPELKKHEVVDRVLENLEMDSTLRPSVRRAKGELVAQLKIYLQVLT